MNEEAVAGHYGDSGLLARILKGLGAAGADIENLKPDDLAPVEEFHIGGRLATTHAVSKLSLSGDSRVLDVGCGIGGAVRYIAGTVGCRVSGIDLTPEFIDVANALTGRTGLGDRVDFKVASALAMPFEAGTFDAAITFHVAMNISDRPALYAEVARVLKPGASFCIYDVMKKDATPLTYPVPWAETDETSHLTTPDEMRALLHEAGFEVKEVEDRSDIALDFLQQRSTAATDGPPPLGVHLLMGASAPVKFKNTLDNIQRGCIAPVQMIATRR